MLCTFCIFFTIKICSYIVFNQCMSEFILFFFILYFVNRLNLHGCSNINGKAVNEVGLINS